MKKRFSKINALALAFVLAFQPCLVHAEVTEEVEYSADAVMEEAAEMQSDTDLVTEEITEEVTREPAAAGPYTITFDRNDGGGTFSTMTTASNGYLTILNTAPYRAGYNFAGWCSTPTGSPEYKPAQGYTFTSNKTLYAKWYGAHLLDSSKATYEISDSISCGEDTRWFAVIPEETVKLRLESTGNLSLKGCIYDDSFYMLTNNSPSGAANNFRIDYTFTANKKYYLKVAGMSSSVIGSYTVKMSRFAEVAFDAQGGDYTPSKITGASGDSVYMDSRIPKKSYTVTFNANGGSCSQASKKLECEFTDWNTEPDGRGDFYMAGDEYIFSKNETLYASYTTPRLGSLPTATKSGASFDGWYTAATGGSKVSSTTEITGNTTLYAHWTTNSYTLSYDVNGGKAPIDSQTGSGKMSVTSQIPLRDGYDFRYWIGDSQADYYMPGEAITLTGNKTLHASWVRWPEFYSGMVYDSTELEIFWGGQERTVVYIPESTGRVRFQSSGSEDTKGMLYDASGNLIAANDDNGSDSNFMIEETLQGGKTYYLKVKYYQNTMTGTTTVYAMKEMTVTFDSQGGSYTPSDIKCFYPLVNAAIPAQVPEKDDIVITLNANGGSLNTTSKKIKPVFYRWASYPMSEYEGTRYYSAGSTICADRYTTLTAEYRDSYGNEISYGELPVPTRSGYSFQGWFTAKTGGTEVGAFDAVNANTTIYAHWKASGGSNPVITSQPKPVTAGINSTVSFSVEATGSNLTYQWQYSKNGGAKWLVSGASGAATDSISVKVSTSNAGNIYRCKITGNGKTIYSETAGVNLIPGVIINKNPQSQVAAIGEYAIFTIDAENAAGYQWQYSKDGAHWYNSGAEGNQTDTLKVKGAQNSQGNHYRCVVTGIDGNKKKSLGCAMIVLKEAPKPASAEAGDPVVFSLKAEGIAEYLWQYSKDGGITWYKSGANGATTDTLSFTAGKTNGLLFRCKLTTPDGSYAYTKPVWYAAG